MDFLSDRKNLKFWSFAIGILSFFFIVFFVSSALADGGPIVGEIIITPSYHNNETTFVSGTSDISAGITYGNDSEIASCYYTIDGGSNWNSANYDSGTCTATGVDTSVATSINMKAIDNNTNEGSGTSVDVSVDTTAPATTKTVGDPNYIIAGQEGGPDMYFVNTSTQFSFDSSDDSAGVNATWFRIALFNQTCGILEPGNPECWNWELWNDSNSNNYIDSGELTPSSENMTNDSVGWIIYNNSFVIPQESMHVIEYYSVDKVGNMEEPRLEVDIVDGTPPIINSAEADNQIIDLESYSGGYASRNQFYEPKCALISVNATDAQGINFGQINSTMINLTDVLLGMFSQVPSFSSFSQSTWDEYLAEVNMSSAMFDGANYTYYFCPGQYIFELLNRGIISYDDFKDFLTEKLVLGEFTLPIFVSDFAGRTSQTSVDVTVVDLSVPLTVGWNLRSTPMFLEGNRFWSSGSIDTVLKWNTSTQLWDLVKDNSISPLDVLFIHATEKNQIGYIFERDLTSPPTRQLYSGWNVVGPALALYDSLQNPCQDWLDEYYNGQHTCDFPLTQLYDDYGTCVESVLSSVKPITPGGNTGWSVAVNPYQHLNYWNQVGYDINYNAYYRGGYFQQDPWVWTSDQQVSYYSGAQCYRNDNYGINADNFGGYWVYMKNDDLLTGFTTTPLLLSG